MIERKAWQDFRDAGLLWWVNRILHTFGWSIVVYADEDTGVINEVYPARTKYLGFGSEVSARELEKFNIHTKTIPEDHWG